CAARGDDAPPNKGVLEDARAILRQTTRIDVLVLDPDAATDKGDPEGTWRILGEAKLTGARARTQLIDALEQGIQERRAPTKAPVRPAYGIRATHSGATVQALIDLDNGVMRILVGENRIDVPIAGSLRDFFTQLFTV